MIYFTAWTLNWRSETSHSNSHRTTIYLQFLLKQHLLKSNNSYEMLLFPTPQNELHDLVTVLYENNLVSGIKSQIYFVILFTDWLFDGKFGNHSVQQKLLS